MLKRIVAVLVVLGGMVALPAAQASLYSASFGTQVPVPPGCDDCAFGPFSFGGGQTINFFGGTYGELYVSTNGYVTFDGPHTSQAVAPIDQQEIGPMIAGLFTDLDPTANPDSQIFVNNSTAGEILVTYSKIGHSGDPSTQSTFQILIRSDQKSIPAGEGQIGFFYGEITDPNDVFAGFGDGLLAIDPREVSFAAFIPGTDLSNSAPRFYTLDGGNGNPPPAGVPEPSAPALLALGLIAAGAASRRRRS